MRNGDVSPAINPRLPLQSLIDLAEVMSLGILVEDPNEQVLFINERLCEYFGFDGPASEWRGVARQTIFSRFGRRCIVKEDRATGSPFSPKEPWKPLKSRDALTLSPGSGGRGTPICWLADGRMLTCQHVVLDGEQKLRAWIFKDVTRLQQLEQTLEASEERRKALLAGSLDAIIMFDRRGLIIEWNAAAERILGYTRGETLGQDLAELILPEDERVKHQTRLRGDVEDFEQGVPAIVSRRLMLTALRKNGEPFSCEMTVAQTLLDRRPVFTAFLRDITEQQNNDAELLKAKEVAEAANQAKTRFIASMSHEVRTPLNAIIGLTGLMLDSEMQSEERDECLQTVNSSARFLLNLINDILDISRIEAERIQLEEVAFSIREIIDDVFQILRLRANDKGLKMRTEVADRTPDLLVGDPGRLRQILINLVSNAIKYTDDGEVVMSVGCEPRSDFARAVHITFDVSDTGLGIPPELVDKIFTRFYQIEHPRWQQRGGAGLGLSITQSLIELMGGTLSLRSVVGKGSVFTVSLTLAVAQEGHRPSSGLRGHDFSRDLEPMTSISEIAHAPLLVVEDHLPNLYLMQRILTNAGFEVDTAENGAVAVDKAQYNEYALILMDIQMPVMNGIEAAREIRRREYNDGRAPTPILALTAHVLDGFRERCLASGMDDYLPKPINRRRLLRVVKQWIVKINSRSEASPPDDPSRPITLVSARALRQPEAPASEASASEAPWARASASVARIPPSLESEARAVGEASEASEAQTPASPTAAVEAQTPASPTAAAEAQARDVSTLLEGLPPIAWPEDEDARDLLPIFLTHSFGNVHEMEAALTRGDFPLILRTAHKLKGSGYSYGFTGVSTMGAAIERAAQVQDCVEVERCLGVLRVYLERAIKMTEGSG